MNACALDIDYAAGEVERLPLVYIKSAPNSGSTLLAAQLGTHPDVGTVGELRGTRYRAQPGYRCSCGAELARCSFWQSVSAAMARRGFPDSAGTDERDVRNAPNRMARRLLKPLVRGPLLEYARDLAVLVCPGGLAHIRRHQRFKAALVESIVECTGKRVLVDSSKTGMQLKYDLSNPRLDTKVIWLVRDGRGTALSLMRNAGMTMRQAAYAWRRSNEEARAIVRSLPASRWTQVRYETFCIEPKDTLAALWRFSAVAAEAGSAAAEHHILGHRSRLAGSATIQLDDKWRRALSAQDLGTFERVAGSLNRELGYRAP
jgi:hypothetical protein